MTVRRDLPANPLIQRIEQSLSAASDRCLISDRRVAWTGYDILARLQPLRACIEAVTAPRSFVVIAFPNSATKALMILAVLSSDRVPIILGLEDFESDPDRWLKGSPASLVVAPAGALRGLASGCAMAALDADGVIELHRPLPGSASGDVPPRPCATPGAAHVLYTSGSSGQPKAIQIPIDGLLRTVDFLIARFALGHADRAPIILPICHSMALNTQFFAALLAGAHCHFVETSLSLNRLYRTISERQGTFVSLVAETLELCANEKKRRQVPACTETRHVQLAGGLITSRHLKLARELFPNAVIHKGYGLTEAIRVTMSSSRDDDFESDSVGSPLPFLELEIRDESGARCAPGVAGEIHVRGPSVHVGTLDPADASASHVDGAGFLPTGDLGQLDACGRLRVFGRLDGQIKIAGHRVSSLGIERSALETSELITNARCILVDDSRGDELRGPKMVLLLEVPLESQEAFVTAHLEGVEREIYRRLKALPRFPKEVAILSRFPRTPNGKIALSRLSGLYIGSRKSVIRGNPRSVLQFFRIPAA